MNDGFGVRRFQSICHLEAVLRHALQVYGLSVDPVFQRVPFQEFHDNEVLAFVLVHVINRADVRMIQRGSSPCFPLKSFNRQGIPGELLRKELQRYVAAESQILGFIDHTHPATAQLLQDAVVRDSEPNHNEETAIRRSY